MSTIRHILRLMVCIAALALFLLTLLFLLAAVSYYADIPEIYGFYAPEALEEQLAKGQIWVTVQAVLSLLAAGICFAAVRSAWKKRNQGGEKQKYHGDETSDSQRY